MFNSLPMMLNAVWGCQEYAGAEARVGIEIVGARVLEPLKWMGSAGSSPTSFGGFKEDIG